MGCHRLWCWGILLNSWQWWEQLEPVSSGCAGVAGAVEVDCMHVMQAGGDAGCAAKKQWLDRACGVAVVPT